MWLRGFWALRAGSGRLGPRGLPGPPPPPPRKSPLLQAARDYARPAQKKKKQEIASHLSDLPPTMLQWKYASVPAVDQVDDVVRRMLSLEMASQKDKVKIKKEQLADKVRKSPNDNGSFEVQIAYLTAKIRTLQEHLHLHPKVAFSKDKANRRYMMMALDQRKMLLKYLRNSRYDVFENTCKQLDIEYVPSPLYHRRPTRRWMAKKALCIKVFQEVQKLKAQGELKPRRKGQGRARPTKLETALQNEGTPV